MNSLFAQTPAGDTSQFIFNNVQRSPTVFAIDVSGSMAGAAIGQANRGLQVALNNIAADSQAIKACEVAIIAFSDSAQLVQPFDTVDRITAPILKAKGQTHMGEAITLALKIIEERQNLYRAARQKSLKPNLVIISDGAPNDDWKGPAKQLGDLHDAGRLFFYPVAVDGGNTALLSGICRQPALHIESDDLVALFKFISDSMRSVSQKSVTEQAGFGHPEDM